VHALHLWVAPATLNQALALCPLWRFGPSLQRLQRGLRPVWSHRDKQEALMKIQVREEADSALSRQSPASPPESS
jgi:hypothetical protein